MAQSVGSPPLVVMRYLVAPHRSYFAGMAQSVGSPPLVVMRYLVAPHRSYFAGMAQSVEHVIGNDEVISSILITSSKAPTQMRRCFCVYGLPCVKGADSEAD